GAVEDVDHMALDVDETKLEHGKDTDRPCPNDHGVGLDDVFGHGQLGLLLGNTHDETVKRVGDFDLTAQPAFAPNVESEVEHVLLHLRRASGRLAPGFIDVDMTGCASAGAAAFGGNAGYGVLHRRLHHRHARLGFHDVLGSVVQNIG